MARIYKEKEISDGFMDIYSRLDNLKDDVPDEFKTEISNILKLLDDVESKYIGSDDLLDDIKRTFQYIDN